MSFECIIAASSAWGYDSHRLTKRARRSSIAASLSHDTKESEMALSSKERVSLRRLATLAVVPMWLLGALTRGSLAEGTNMKRRKYHGLRYLLLLLLLLAITSGSPATAASDSDVIEKNCEVVNFPIYVPAHRVDPFVPEELTLRVENGLATVYLGGVACDTVTVKGRETTSYIHVFLRTEIEYPESNPDSDDLLANMYWFYLATNSGDIVDYFRTTGDLPNETVVRVKDLRLARNTATGAVTLEAPAPTPSPFRITATTGGPMTPEVEKLFLNHWAVARHGRMAIKDDVLIDVQARPATGQLEILDQGSDLGLMLCPPYGKAIPIADAFADARFAESTYSVKVERMAFSRTTRPGPCP